MRWDEWHKLTKPNKLNVCFVTSVTANELKCANDVGEWNLMSDLCECGERLNINNWLLPLCGCGYASQWHRAKYLFCEEIFRCYTEDGWQSYDVKIASCNQNVFLLNHPVGRIWVSAELIQAPWPYVDTPYLERDCMITSECDVQPFLRGLKDWLRLVMMEETWRNFMCWFI